MKNARSFSSDQLSAMRQAEIAESTQGAEAIIRCLKDGTQKTITKIEELDRMRRGAIIAGRKLGDCAYTLYRLMFVGKDEEYKSVCARLLYIGDTNQGVVEACFALNEQGYHEGEVVKFNQRYLDRRIKQLYFLLACPEDMDKHTVPPHKL